MKNEYIRGEHRVQGWFMVGGFICMGYLILFDMVTGWDRYGYPYKPILGFYFFTLLAPIMGSFAAAIFAHKYMLQFEIPFLDMLAAAVVFVVMMFIWYYLFLRLVCLLKLLVDNIIEFETPWAGYLMPAIFGFVCWFFEFMIHSIFDFKFMIHSY